MKLPINSREVAFKPDLETGFWMKEKILIYDNDNSISESEIKKIKEYLYDEGFILDRRTPYEIVQVKSAEPPADTE